MNELEKRKLNSLYGRFWNPYPVSHRGRYVIRKGFRGSGMLYAAAQRVGYDALLGKLIRIRLRYPLWCEGDDLIRELQLKIQILQSCPGRVMYVGSDSLYQRTK